MIIRHRCLILVYYWTIKARNN